MTIEKYHDRKEAEAYLAERGLSITKNTLQKYATTGGGPAYRKFGNRVVYTTADLDAWIESKLSGPRTSTSEAA